MLRTIILLGTIAFLCNSAIAQNLPLRDALSQLEAKHNITFSYADDLIEELTVTEWDNNLSLQNQISVLQSQTGLEIQSSASSIYIVKSVSRDVCARILIEGTDTPLQGAQLVSHNLSTNIISDSDGFIRFKTDFTFQKTMTIKYVGYSDKTVTVKDLVNEQCSDIQMVFGFTTLNEVVITNYLASGINADLTDFSLNIKSEDLALLPGETDGDLLLALRSLPGVSSPNGKPGNIHMRGGTTDQTLLLFDNIPIYHKGHYLGAVSPYNPSVVNEVSVHRSGFDPTLGGRVGGVIKLATKKSIADSANATVGVNSYYGTAAFQLPVNDEFMITGGVRSSYPNGWNTPKLDAINELVYQGRTLFYSENDPNTALLEQNHTFLDYNFSSVYNVGKAQMLFSFLGIENTGHSAVQNIDRGNVLTGDLELNNKGASLQWRQFWSSKTSTNLTLMKSAYEYRSILEENLPNRPSFIPDDFTAKINDLALNLDLKLILDQQSETVITLGYQLNNHDVLSSRFNDRPNQPTTNIVEESEAMVHAGIANLETRPTDDLSFNVGLRTNYYSPTSETFIEPRLMASYAINDKWTLKSSYGHYSQYIVQNLFFDFEDIKVENYTWFLADDFRPVITSRQFMFGNVWKIRVFIIDIEFYDKFIDDLSVVGGQPNPDDPMGRPVQQFRLGDLKVQGVDILLKKHWPNLDAWVSYSYMHSEMNFPEINQLSFITYYEQPHILNVAGSWFKNRWKFSLGWQHTSGVPVYTNSTFFPQPGEGGEPPQGMDRSIPSEVHEGRFTPQHQLDLAAIYDFTPPNKAWIGSIGLSILNVYDRENLVSKNLITRGQNTTLDETYAIGFAPNLMVNFKF
ncbi:MAG: TonB-dependent receptor plug domain-containing protein [Cyclobacteriaceae bacterium]